MEMKVDMNGIRKKLVNSVARLTKKLNRAVDVEDNRVHIDVEELRDNMNELQSLVVGLCCTYEDGNETFVSLADYVEQNLPDFMPLPEDE